MSPPPGIPGLRVRSRHETPNRDFRDRKNETPRRSPRAGGYHCPTPALARSSRAELGPAPSLHRVYSSPGAASQDAAFWCFGRCGLQHLRSSKQLGPQWASSAWHPGGSYLVPSSLRAISGISTALVGPGLESVFLEVIRTQVEFGHEQIDSFTPPPDPPTAGCSLPSRSTATRRTATSRMSCVTRAPCPAWSRSPHQRCSSRPSGDATPRWSLPSSDATVCQGPASTANGSCRSPGLWGTR